MILPLTRFYSGHYLAASNFYRFLVRLGWMEVSSQAMGSFMSADTAPRSAFVGLAVLVICLPVPAYLGKAMAGVQKAKMEAVRNPFPFSDRLAHDLANRPINEYNL